MKLNLACGTDIRDGWQNLDVVEKWPIARRGCDVVWDARKDMIPFPDDAAEEVYAGYLLLHLAPCYHSPVLKEIYRVAAPGASVVFGEVDMAKVMARFLENPRDKTACELIWGEQGDIHGTDLAEFDKHCHGFTERSLRSVLREHGFVDRQRIQVHVAEVWYELTIRCTTVTQGTRLDVPTIIDTSNRADLETYNSWQRQQLTELQYADVDKDV